MTDIYTLFPSFKKIMPRFLDKKNVFAVFGARNDPTLSAYKVFENLKKSDLKVYAVNPQEEEVMGEKCYPDIKSLPAKPDVVCIVTPPSETLSAVKQCLAEKIRMIWIEPGSETQKAIDLCKAENVDVIYYHSIIKERISPTEKELEKLGKTIS
jgi:hypothetical protein